MIGSLQHILLVALGGALGSVLRYQVSGWLLPHTLRWGFPIGTFVVNVAGCLLMGLLAGLMIKHEYFSHDSRLLLTTGLLGGFTTFSAFGLDLFYLLRRQEFVLAGGYVLCSVVMGLLVLWIGYSLIPHRG